MKFKDFKNMDILEQKEYLKSAWGVNKILVKLESNHESKIVNPLNPATMEKLVNPFTGEDVNCYVNFANPKNDIDFIFFDFDINIHSKILEKDKLIKAVEESISEVITYKEILEEIDPEFDYKGDSLFGISKSNIKDLKSFNEIKQEVKDNIERNRQLEWKNRNLKFKNKQLKIDEKRKRDDYRELNKEYQSLKDEIDNNFEDRKKEKEKELNNYLEELNRVVEIKDNELNELNKKIRAYKNEVKAYENLGIRIPRNNTEKQEGPIQDLELENIISNIQKNIFAESGFKYSKDTIRRYYMATLSNQLIILKGKPGTGKTSIVSKFANAINANYKIIPVQMTWTDKNDLIGYYNPLDQRYNSTDFLEAINEANGNQDKLYFICLDEMNLSRVEYYFAELLSVMELNHSDQIISLHNENLKSLRENLKFYKTLEGYSKEKIFDKELQIEHLLKYNKLNISSNIRFVGTINADETTNDLSPKIIDRSLIIHFEYNQDLKFDTQSTHVKNIYFSPQHINNIKAYQLEEKFESKIAEIKNLLFKINIVLAGRFDSQIKKIFSYYIQHDKKDHFMDDIIMMKVLPKINVSYMKNTDLEYKVLEKLKEILEEFPKSYRTLEDMIESSAAKKIISFWS